MNTTLIELCHKHTALLPDDIEIIARFTEQLPVFANLTGNDMFIDVLTANNQDALVVAEAKPINNSLYSHCVIGAIAYKDDEPAVYDTLTTANINREIRGLSQEGIPMAQTVVPILNNRQKVIAALIMERDISRELRQEEHVELLSQTADRLSNTLLYLSKTEANFEEWVGNGIFVLNRQGIISYANKEASRNFKDYCGIEAIGSSFSILIPGCNSVYEFYDYFKNAVEMTLMDRRYRFQSYPLFAQGELTGCVISVQDVTDLRQKEQELNEKSIIIREIHHRVKNNLQNVAALLRLQMRRSDTEIIKAEFTESINRIISIALVHDVFAHQLWDMIDLKQLAERVADSLHTTLVTTQDRVQITVEGQAIQLSSNQAVPISLIINELVTNCIKHGIGSQNNGVITISITDNKGMVELLITDNGSEPNELPLGQNNSNHLGLQIVTSLVNEQLGGSFQLQRTAGLTRALVTFPKPKGRDDL